MRDNEIMNTIEILAKNRVMQNIGVTYNGMPLKFLFEEILRFVTSQKAEIERLIGLASQNAGVLPQYEAFIKREAATEFAEMVKAKINDHLLKKPTTWNSYRFNVYEAEMYGEIIDNLVKEITEGV